jgi:mannan endo-1,4-beta-mannosidase
MTDYRTQQHSRSAARRASRRRATRTRKFVYIGVIGAVLVIGAAVVLRWAPWRSSPVHPTGSVRYLGVFEPDSPTSYAQVNEFAQAIGRQPNLVSYYSAWDAPFQAGFASSATKHGALTLVQIDPKNVSLAKIAAGRYDKYLHSYATAVKAFRARVVLSFGHEMNGNWYSWSNRHTPAKVFVAAWRHVVTVFRNAGATNATWLWTVNVIDQHNTIPIVSPAPWWPGSRYVNWVGIDGYYYQSSQSFSQVFGPTIAAVRELTGDPVLISETGVAPSAGQPAKISDLFSGVRSFGLLGFVWFDENTQGRVWRINSQAAFQAFGQNAKQFVKRSSAAGASPQQ